MIRRITIGRRAFFAFGLIGTLTIALGLFSINRINAVENKLVYISQHIVPATEHINGISREFLRLRVHSANLASFYNDPERAHVYQDKLNDAIKQVDNAQSQFVGLSSDDMVIAEFKRYSTLYKQYLVQLNQLRELARSQSGQKITALREDTMIPLTNEITASINNMLEREQYLIDTSTSESNRLAENGIVLVTVVMIIVVILVILSAIVLTRSIIRPIDKAVNLAKAIASRDLTQAVEIEGKDEPAELLRQLMKTQTQLRQSVVTIAESSEQLATTSEELSSVTAESARTIQEQTSELEQAATAVNELTTASETVAQDAQNASQASDDANTQTQTGNARVRDTIQAIESLSAGIDDSSDNVTALANKVQSITRVLDVISGIADQTNLLALNAAIEAARAGESGRGFAVVADEVRSLAHKTQQSTVEIEEMVRSINEASQTSVATMENSLERAAKTTEVAKQAGQALALIAKAVEDINGHNASIASAAEEQANVSRDVDSNILRIRDLSNSTASGAEQTSVSSRELSRLANEMNELVKQFKI